MPAPAERRGELIHHSDVDARGALLVTLARKRGLDAVKLRAQADRDRDQQRGRRAEAGPRRYVGFDGDRLRWRAELVSNRAKVAEPATHVAFDRPLPGLVPADSRVPIDRGRQNDTPEVVDVLPDEVHASGCAAVPRIRTLAARLHAAPRLCPLPARRL